MTQALKHRLPDPRDTDIVFCTSKEGLAVIGKPDTELAIWERTLPFCLQTWLNQLDAAVLPNFRILVDPRDVRRAIVPHMDNCGMPSGDMRELLVSDIEDLVSAFAGITGSDLVDIRLERVDHDACWKFHRDCVEARLLTTYRGLATEWVHRDNETQALQNQKNYDGPLEQFQSNDVAIFKGSSAGPGSGVVHRSPPIAGTGHTRLLLCLNKRSMTSPEPWPADDRQETGRS